MSAGWRTELTSFYQAFEIVDRIHNLEVPVKLVLLENGIFKALVIRRRKRGCSMA